MRTAPALLVVALLLQANPAAAQHVEVAPFAGYRFGGDYLEFLTGAPQDADGGPVLGATVDVPIGEGLAVEGLYTRQTIDRAVAEYYHAGGIQEFDTGPIRPYLTGTLGLTRFALAGDNEVRFSIAAGGGVKLWPARHVGVRLDGRVFVTFIDAEGSAAICGSGGCLTGLHVSTVWQAEFTAGVVFSM